MIDPAATLLALIGIGVSGYTADELDELLAQGVTNRIEPAPEPLPVPVAPAPGPMRDAVAQLNRFNLELADDARRRRNA